MSSAEHEAKIPEFKVVTQYTELPCSLICKSGLYVFILYIIIELSLEPDTNLLSFNIVKQVISDLWLFSTI